MSADHTHYWPRTPKVIVQNRAELWLKIEYTSRIVGKCLMVLHQTIRLHPDIQMGWKVACVPRDGSKWGAMGPDFVKFY